MTGIFELQSIARYLGVAIVGCLVEGTILAFFAGMVLRFSHRPSSGTRFAVWFSTLMMIAALPMISHLVWWHSESLHLVKTRPAIMLPSSWALYLFGAWAAVATWGFVRVGAGLWQMRALRKSSALVDPVQLDAALRETLALNRGPRTVSLRTSAQVRVPTAIGLVEPMVIVPQWVMNELCPDELNQILLHELAHLRRFDDWTNLAQKVVKALFFFHPAVWWIEKKLSLEREMACDDAVLEKTARPRAYAECLTRLAEKSLGRRGLALAQAALGHVRQTSLRVAQILDPKRGGRTGLVTPILGLSASVLAVVLCTTPFVPQIVAFQIKPDRTGVQPMQLGVNADMERAVTNREATVASSPMQSGAISAAFHPQATQIQTKLKLASRRNTAPVDANAARQQLPVQQTVVVVQTIRYDASGSAVRTLCIWRIQGNNLAERQLESAIFAGLI